MMAWIDFLRVVLMLPFVYLAELDADEAKRRYETEVRPEGRNN